VPLPGGAQNGWALQVDNTSSVGFSWALNTAHSFIRVAATTTPYVTNGSEFLLAVKNASTGPVIIVLAPGVNWQNKFLLIKTEKGDEDTNSITVNTSDGSLIEGQSSFVIDQPFGHVWVYHDGVQFQVF